MTALACQCERHAERGASTRRWSRRRFATDPQTLAKSLIGQRLVRVLETGERLAGLIVETEAYLGQIDKAAHSSGGRRTLRNESMYGPAGTAYVYFTYGMHHCFNIVCGRPNEPVAALIRAVHPTEGLAPMRRLRLDAGAPSMLTDRGLCSGPAKLCQAMAIDRRLDGVDLTSHPALFIENTRPGKMNEDELINTARIGVGYAGEWADAPLRWRLAKCPHVSRR